MAQNDVIVAKEGSGGVLAEIALAPADIGAVASNDARLTDARTPTSHTHGNITNDGKIGTTANLPVKTGTNGVLGAGAFGTAAGQFAEGNHTHTLSAITDAGTAAAQDADQDLGTTDDVTYRSVTVVGDPIEGTGSFNKGLFSGNALELSTYTLPDPADELPYIKFNGFMSGSTALRPYSGSGNFNINLPNASGTIALTSDFAAPPAIGNTTAAAISGTTGTFTTLTANTSLTLGTSGILTGGTNLIEQVNGTNGQTFNLYRTTSSANANYERGFIRWGGTSSNTLQIGTEQLGTGAARAFELVHGGGVVLRSIGVGAVSIPNGCQLVFGDSNSVFYWNGGPVFRQEANYTFALRDGNNANTVRIYQTWASTTSFERLNIIAQSGGDVLFGTQKGTTGGLARGLQFQTDNTTRLTIGSTGGFTLADAQDIAVGTTTGTKIGTATSQKIGFFNATPVVQQAAVADATDAASTQARLNDLLAAVRTLGLIAT